MVKAISATTEITADHELRITLPDDVPVGPADVVLVVVPKQPGAASTLGELANSEFFGIWRDREDITDSRDFARRLREEGWRRSA